MTQDMEKLIEEMVRKTLAEKSEFSNVARPKATKASTATQGAWNIDKEPKASSATQGSWDSTDTPGGVSHRAKEVWTTDALVAAVTKVVNENAAFINKPLPGEKKPSASKILSGEKPSGKVSASTQPSYIDQMNAADAATKKKISASVCAQILSNVYKLK